eukprot:Plantae.Rhodophyta-Palmaria_palmata.ctg30231.p1 GENE.Plantae.Rhodophyta-Palmaria_palmata.ctg30231~~Plantae.Rhodophyta-Palmaria_palmata.ctg30231.p1  ORF type:complete len:142 (+),score=24.24 Plantae.Rhodophyta-Palmaria_palmata.ctg30231:65-427(+)
MESSARYSIGKEVPSSAVSHAIEIIEEKYRSEFWAPGAISYDLGFDSEEFKSWLKKNEIIAEPVGARRHNKLPVESKHKICRDIFIRLREANPSARFSLLIARMFDISNVPYGNGVLSAF